MLLDPPINPPEASADAHKAARLSTRRRERKQMVRMVLGSYVIDFMLLLLLSMAGGLHTWIAFAYFGTGAAVSGAFYAVLGTGFSDRFKDHYMAGPQMVIHAAVNLSFTLLAPEIGVLLMMVMIIVFAFGVLSVNPRNMRSGPMMAGALLAIAVVAVISIAGNRLSLPTATWPQRLVCGIWVALILARSTFVGLYSAQLRSLLNKRNREIAAAFEKLEIMANRDELTGALNRRSVMRLLEEECQRMDRTGQCFGVAMFDLDHFKHINDAHGHLVGDEALRQFIRAATAGMRNTDRIGRYGGEEFLMVLTAIDLVSVARATADRVRRSTMAHDWSQVAPNLKVTVSAGVAIRQAGETPEQLLQRADRALYTAKHEGRNCVREASLAVAPGSMAQSEVQPH